jgi:hypothetical protein
MEMLLQRLEGRLPDMRTVLEVLLLLGALVILAVITRRGLRRATPDLSDYTFGDNVVVRCSEGHLFTTTWIPMMSFKAIRLGLVGFQYCPLCDHATFITPVRNSELTDRERHIAEQHHDGLLP